MTKCEDNSDLESLLSEIRACRLCEADLPMGPRPTLGCASTATILVAGQAPGVRVHETGIPWNDPSGNRLRDWMGIDRDVFYDPGKIAIVPMGFCYPGTNPRGGDFPPRPECSRTWHDRVMALLPNIRLTLTIGQYAQAWHMRGRTGKTLTETVANWRDVAPEVIPLPHPSGRNNIWLKRNPWFAEELLPELKASVRRHLEEG